MTKLSFAFFWAEAFRTALLCAPLRSPPSSGAGPAPAKIQASFAGRVCALRQSFCALLWACTIVHASADAMSRQEIEATLAAAMTQVVDQYVDPLDSRVLVVHGLSALKALPGAEDPSRKAAIEQAVLTGHQTEGMTPQIRILTGEILRFDNGSPREMALDAALRGMMAGLDPYSRVATRAELAAPPASVGLELSIRDGALTVVRPLPGSPGERAGVQAGDIVTHVDGRATAGLPLPEAVALLRGTAGTRPTLTLRRPGSVSAITAQPVRGPVQAPPTVRWDLDGAIAVIRISAFDSRTGRQLKDALDAASAHAEAPLSGLVLDLRGNAGGLLDAAEQVAGMVLPEGSEIGSLRGRTPDNARTLRARAPPRAAGGSGSGARRSPHGRRRGDRGGRAAGSRPCLADRHGNSWRGHDPDRAVPARQPGRVGDHHRPRPPRRWRPVGLGRGSAGHAFGQARPAGHTARRHCGRFQQRFGATGAHGGGLRA